MSIISVWAWLTPDLWIWVSATWLLDRGCPPDELQIYDQRMNLTTEIPFVEMLLPVVEEWEEE